MSYNNFLLSMIVVTFIGFVFSASSSVPPKTGTVTVDHDNVEVSFLPTHALYQKRCIVDGQLVYCVSADVLSTVSIDHDEVEIDFVADAQ